MAQRSVNSVASDASALSRFNHHQQLDDGQRFAFCSLPARGGFCYRSDRRHFMRVCVESNGKVRLSGTQASHMLSSLAGANGLVDVPPGKILEAGATVQVLRIDL